MAVIIVWVVFVYIGYWLSIGGANGAPQQCAIAAMSMVGMLFPYILARLACASKSLSNQEKIIQLLLNGQLPEEKNNPWRVYTGEWNNYANVFMWVLVAVIGIIVFPIMLGLIKV